MVEENKPKTGNNYFVAHDGSQASIDAFKLVSGSLMTKDDELTIGHVFNHSKTYLEHRMKPDNVKAEVDAEIVGYGHKGNMMWEPAHSGMTTKEHVCDMAKRSEATIMAVGWHGRKGPKTDPTIMGSAVQHISINPPCPVLILKDAIARKDKERGAFRWAVLVDGSPKSWAMFRFVATILDKAKDEVHIITVNKVNTDIKAIQEYAEQESKSLGVKYKFIRLERPLD